MNPLPMAPMRQSVRMGGADPRGLAGHALLSTVGLVPQEPADLLYATTVGRECGDADAFVSGLTYDYPDVIRPALQIHHTFRNTARAAGVYIMIVEDRVYLFTDATVNIEPSAEDLYEIACLAADFAQRLEIEPRVAFLSFSNFGSVIHPLTQKVKKATEIVKLKAPELVVDGEMQSDTAVVSEILQKSFPFASLKESANILIFPDLNSGNICYKLLHKLGGAETVGPILMGMEKPIHVLQRGVEVRPSDPRRRHKCFVRDGAADYAW